jgi:uncharacterized protein
MLFVLSPAKSLDYETPLAPDLPHSQPLFTAQATELIEVLRPLSPQNLAQLMDLSDALAGLNAARYAAWRPRHGARNARQAVMAFNGDVYEGLDARSLSVPDLEWAQRHVGILSGLYGVLRPLDRMQPYRLEMGTRLVNPRGKDLYRFWGDRIARYLDSRLARDPEPVLVNLASQEYFRSVDRRALKARVIECVFEEERGQDFQVISFFAKRARGLMVRYAITRRIDRPAQLTGFNLDGYAHAPAASEPDRLVFRRRAA